MKKGILGFGLIFFLYAVYLDRFETSIIIGFTALLSWMAINLLWISDRDYKRIGNTLIGAGLIISISIFINFGIEPTPFPIGGFVFNNDGIYKAITLLFLFIVSGFLFKYLDELVPDEITPTPEIVEQEEKPEFESDDWEVISEEELLIGDYESLKE